MNTDWRVEWSGSRWIVVRDCPNGLPGELDSMWLNKQHAIQRRNWLNAIDWTITATMTTHQIWNDDYKLLLEVWDGREEPYFLPNLTPSCN